MSAKLPDMKAKAKVRQPQLILDYLASGEKRYADILRHLGAHGGTHTEVIAVSVTLNRMVDEGKIERVERGLYRLSEGRDDGNED